MNKKVRLLFTGTGRWAHLLSDLVNRYAGDIYQAEALPAALHSVFRLPTAALAADVVVRVGFRPGMAGIKPRIFDMAWRALEVLKPKTTLIFYWIGSDIFYQAKDMARGQLTVFFAKSMNGHHIVGAPWFVEELNRLGISASAVLFPLNLPQIVPSLLKGERRRVLTYIPDGRPGFYGAREVIRLAREFPGVNFDIVGGRGGWANPKPTNVTFHGWVDRITPFLELNPIVIRLVEHDALGGTVREGLHAGCNVIYSIHIPNVLHVPFGDYSKLRSVFSTLIEADRKGTLSRNARGRAYAAENWDAMNLTRQLVAEIDSMRAGPAVLEEGNRSEVE